MSEMESPFFSVSISRGRTAATVAAFDDGIQTAAAALGALTLGVTHAFGNGLELAPFVRGQLGRVESAGESSAARGFAGGVTFTRRF